MDLGVFGWSSRRFHVRRRLGVIATHRWADKMPGGDEDDMGSVVILKIRSSMYDAKAHVHQSEVSSLYAGESEEETWLKNTGKQRRKPKKNKEKTQSHQMIY